MGGWTLGFALDDEWVRKRLMAYDSNARDLTPAMELIGISGMASTDMRFEREVDPDGQAWAALAPSTIKHKAKAGREGKLQWSKRLRSGFTRQVNRTSVTWGVNLPYARAQQHGATITRHAQTLLDSRISMRRVKRTATRKDGTITEYAALLFARAGDKRVVAMARRVVGAGQIVIPARPYAGINDEERVLYVTIIKDHIMAKRGWSE